MRRRRRPRRPAEPACAHSRARRTAGPPEPRARHRPGGGQGHHRKLRRATDAGRFPNGGRGVQDSFSGAVTIVLSHLSFLTLQRGNALRDALRHTYARHRSLQSPQKEGGYPPLCACFSHHTAENRHLSCRIPATVTSARLILRGFDIKMTPWHAYCYLHGRDLPCAARQNKSLQCRRVSAL
ncbi:DUF1534 domain-containing protein [Pseudomonas syringae]|nr:DUF1534 domain-containing protein [Pseudomonas syringae]